MHCSRHRHGLRDVVSGISTCLARHLHPTIVRHRIPALMCAERQGCCRNGETCGLCSCCTGCCRGPSCQEAEAYMPALPLAQPRVPLDYVSKCPCGPATSRMLSALHARRAALMLGAPRMAPGSMPSPACTASPFTFTPERVAPSGGFCTCGRFAPPIECPSAESTNTVSPRCPPGCRICAHGMPGCWAHLHNSRGVLLQVHFYLTKLFQLSHCAKGFYHRL